MSTSKLMNTKKNKKIILIIEDDDDEEIVVKQNSNKMDLKIISQNNIIMKRWNEDFIELMEKLSDIMFRQGESFRARAYQKAQETIMAFIDDITNPEEQLKGKPGIGETIMEKLKEFVSTGTLKLLEREKNNPVNILTNVYGIGPKKAEELVKNGIKTIEDLRKNQALLNDIQIVGLKYYEDILARIPRSEIDTYSVIFDKTFKSVTNGSSSSDSLKYEIVGSYRRGAETSGDIDVIITSERSEIYKKFVDNLIKENIIIEVLSRGPTKTLVITKLPNGVARRVDFLYTSPEEYPFSVLYFTGSKIFNTVMRHIALTKGFTMNEHGMYEMVGKKKGDKISHSFKCEKDIFDFLGLVYKEPKERKDGRSVVAIGSEPVATNTTTTLVIEDEDEEPEIIFSTNVKIIKKIKKNKSLKNKKKIIVEANKAQSKEGGGAGTIELDPEEIIVLIDKFKWNGIQLLDELTEPELTSILNYANTQYRNNEPVMTDNEFDIIQEYVEKKYPKNTVVKQIGAPVEKMKAKLPYFMGSMDKIKPDTGALDNWCQKFTGPYVLSCKLDGVSGLFTTEGDEAKLYTRGDGKIGQDVSHLIPYLKLPLADKGIVIRGEFIMKKSVFNEKYSTEFANPRNLVSGVVNRITIDPKIEDIDFVAYEVIVPHVKPSSQFAFLDPLGVNIAPNETKDCLTNEYLSNKLLEWRGSCEYEIDGVIVADDKVYERKEGNPAYAFAFKMVLSEQIAEAKVVDVIWSPSKDGFLKPRVQIEPIALGGVTIEYATGFNAAFIEKNKIGVGAVIEIIRSGDVIPYIRGVTSPATQAKMPDVLYKWNETHVDILLEDASADSTVREKLITAFFKGIGVENLSSGNIARIIEAGFDSIPKIIKMSKSDLLLVQGFKEKMADKIYGNIQSGIAGASLLTLMAASNILGRGLSEKKLEPILEAYPDILTSDLSSSKKIEMLKKVKGIAEKSAELFVSNIPKFLVFLQDCGLQDKLKLETNSNNNTVVSQDHPLYKKSIVMTGFRDDDIKDLLKKVGATLSSSVSKNTFIVLSKNPDDKTGKILDAENLGVKIMTPVEFLGTYFVNT